MGVETLAQSIKVLKRLLVAPTIRRTIDAPQSNSSNYISTIQLPIHQQHGGSCVFNQAFQIPEMEEVTTLRDVRINAAAVTFNLALAHQLQVHGRRCALEKAESLYQMSLKLLDMQSNQQDSCTSLIVQLASINNLSQIHLDVSGDTFHCNMMATKAVRQVRSFVSMVQSPNGTNGGLSFDDPNVQELLMNVLLLKSPQVAPAA